MTDPLHFLEYGIPLSQFRSATPCPVFHQPNCPLPEFLSENLLDEDRVIKYFQKDPQTFLKVFYYQYLKLCFEMESTDYQVYISKIEEILAHPDFEFVFEKGHDPQVFNDLQFKRLILEFMEVLDGEHMTVEIALAVYPIMDQVFVLFLRSLLIQQRKCRTVEENIPREELFEFLASFFFVDIALYENCLKFIDSDVFIYQDSPLKIFMIYIDCKDKDSNVDFQSRKQICELANIHNQKSEGNISSVQQIVSKVNIEEMKADFDILNPSQRRVSNLSNANGANSGIYDFVDYTYSRNSEEKLVESNLKDKSSFKLSLNSGSYGDIENLRPDGNIQLSLSTTKNAKSSREEILILASQEEAEKRANPAMDVNRDRDNISSNPTSKRQPGFEARSNLILDSKLPNQKGMDKFIDSFLRAPQINDNSWKQSNNNQQFGMGEGLSSLSNQPVIGTTLSQLKESQFLDGCGLKKNNETWVMPTRPGSAYLSSNLQSTFGSKEYTLPNQESSFGPDKLAAYMQPWMDTNNMALNYLAGLQRNPLKNLSKEFTDSLLLKKISEPYQSNIQMIKSRARAQRKTIRSSYLGY